MKVLHTSDWHLGHTLYNYDRSEEQQAMLDRQDGVLQTAIALEALLGGDVRALRDDEPVFCPFLSLGAFSCRLLGLFGLCL